MLIKTYSLKNLCVSCWTAYILKSLIPRPGGPIECVCVTECGIEALTIRRSWPTRGCCCMEKQKFASLVFFSK